MQKTERVKQKKEVYPVIIKLHDAAHLPVQILSYYGDENFLFRQGQLDAEGTFTTSIAHGNTGIYHFRLPGHPGFDFLFNNEDIEIQTFANHPLDSANVIKSVENKIFFDYLAKHQMIKTKADPVIQLLNGYPVENDFYKSSKTHLISLNEEMESYANEVQENYSGTLAARYVELHQRNYQMFLSENAAMAKDKFLNDYSFKDAELINSRLYPSLILDYLSLFRNPDLANEEQQQTFIPAVDNILTQAFVNDSVYAYAVDYLIKGFKQFDYEKVLQHIYKKHVAFTSCTSDEQVSLANYYEKVKTGSKMPEVKLNTPYGNTLNITKIDAPHIIVAFWASWCNHCTTAIPELYQSFSQQRDKIKIIAISLDQQKDEWTSFIEDHGLDWINVSNLNGWKGEAAEAFGVYATPTYYIFDSNKQLIKKTGNTGDVVSFISGIH